MKHLKKLTKDYKELLTRNGYKSKNYLYERDDKKQIVFINPNNHEDKLIYLKNEGIFKC